MPVGNRKMQPTAKTKTKQKLDKKHHPKKKKHHPKKKNTQKNTQKKKHAGKTHGEKFHAVKKKSVRLSRCSRGRNTTQLRAHYDMSCNKSTCRANTVYAENSVLYYDVLPSPTLPHHPHSLVADWQGLW